MKRNTIIGLSIATGVALSVAFVQPVQALAMDALSIFRVQDMKTIRLTVSDLEHLSNISKDTAHDSKSYAGDSKHIDTAEPRESTLDKVSDFTAFPVSLPKALREETPKLQMIEASTKTITLDKEQLRDKFELPDSLQGSKLTVKTPAVFGAEYDDYQLIATQKPVLDASDATLTELKAALLASPLLTENLRSQLAPIDPKSNDIYLPVLVGVGRATKVGNTTGYLYTESDIQGFVNSLPDTLNPDKDFDSKGSQGAILVWTKDGTLYALFSEKSENDMVRVAGTVQ